VTASERFLNVPCDQLPREHVACNLRYLISISSLSALSALISRARAREIRHSSDRKIIVIELGSKPNSIRALLDADVYLYPPFADCEMYREKKARKKRDVFVNRSRVPRRDSSWRFDDVAANVLEPRLNISLG
jgi:hypothetical protein